MPNDRKEIGPPPFCFPCDPTSRTFPTEWKDIWFRRQAIQAEDGTIQYTCPICGCPFDHRMINYLQGDHIWPYSLFGETSWQNYQLLCGNCNASKGNWLETDVRRVLGAGEFRQLVSKFLQTQVEAQQLSSGAIMRDVLSRSH